MDFAEYQQQLDRLERERGWHRVLASHIFLHMGEELGEIARVLECLEGSRSTERTRDLLREDLADELADLMAFLFKLANQYGLDMGEAMQAQLHKFQARYHDVEQGRREMARYVAYQERNLAWVQGKQKPQNPGNGT
jgi:NTP pyrophosphatase (non-canonical NTP hydrolase)